MMAENDEMLDKMLLDESVDLVPDGIAVIKACQMLGVDVTERITGVDIADFLISELNRQKKSIYLFGAKPEVVETFVNKIKADYPDVQIAGYSDGYVKDRDAVFDEIVNAAPDVCLVALGIPHQEKLIYKHIDRFEKGIFVGVGGSFDVLSGCKARAPQFFIKHNIEWLYRIAKNTSLDFVRKRKQSGISIDSSGEENEGFDIPDESISASPEKQALRNEGIQKLYDALDRLSDEHREIIILRDLNNYSYEDIAAKLCLEVGTVKSRLHRARDTLRRILLKENYF
jgi:N-acetylglucosaminyldiphosphoundecaprenol N-acetyl-beta-D-mannosaminyltransferase